MKLAGMADDEVHPESLAAWRRWLDRNHATSRGVWLVSWKSHTGKPAVGYEDAVTQALAYGWVDSRARTLDGDRSALWYSPRKPTSGLALKPCWRTSQRYQPRHAESVSASVRGERPSPCRAPTKRRVWAAFNSRGCLSSRSERRRFSACA